MTIFKNNILARLIMVVLFFLAVSILVYSGFCVYKISYFTKLQNGIAVYAGQKKMIADVNWFALRIISGLFVSFLVLFAVWKYRSYKNIETIKKGESNFNAVTAAFAMIIPFANTMVPGAIMEEIWATNASQKGEEKKARSVMNNWQFLFAIILVYTLYTFVTFYKVTTPADIVTGLYYKLFLHIMCIHFCFLTMNIIETINERERTKLFFVSMNSNVFSTK